ncbi:hypothetical protein TRVL_08354 [Trypanosoma vivax]|nr:hypothetical protein TRVL_08354 [Trypanosoma vivax]
MFGTASGGRCCFLCTPGNNIKKHRFHCDRQAIFYVFVLLFYVGFNGWPFKLSATSMLCGTQTTAADVSGAKCYVLLFEGEHALEHVPRLPFFSHAAHLSVSEEHFVSRDFAAPLLRQIRMKSNNLKTIFVFPTSVYVCCTVARVCGTAA